MTWRGRFQAHASRTSITAALSLAIAAGGALSLRAQAPSRSEGITVHGAWVIEVRNADGRLADQRNFTNDLVPNGGVELARILAKTNTVDYWNIILTGETAPLADDITLRSNDQPCFLIGVGAAGPAATQTAFPCYLTEPSAGLNVPGAVSSNLQFGIQTTGSGRLVVAGTITTGRDGYIRAVSTHFGAPFAGGAFGTQPTFPSLTRPFTRAVLQTPIQVTAGQLITVSVTYTFS